MEFGDLLAVVNEIIADMNAETPAETKPEERKTDSVQATVAHEIIHYKTRKQVQARAESIDVELKRLNEGKIARARARMRKVRNRSGTTNWVMERALAQLADMKEGRPPVWVGSSGGQTSGTGVDTSMDDRYPHLAMILAMIGWVKMWRPASSPLAVSEPNSAPDEVEHETEGSAYVDTSTPAVDLDAIWVDFHKAMQLKAVPDTPIQSKTEERVSVRISPPDIDFDAIWADFNEAMRAREVPEESVQFQDDDVANADVYRSPVDGGSVQVDVNCQAVHSPLADPVEEAGALCGEVTESGDGLDVDASGISGGVDDLYRCPPIDPTQVKRRKTAASPLVFSHDVNWFFCGPNPSPYIFGRDCQDVNCAYCRGLYEALTEYKKLGGGVWFGGLMMCD